MDEEHLTKRDWIYQIKGIINHHLPKYQKGNQPVRVVHNVILYMFVHANSAFHQRLIEAVLSLGMNSQVDINYGDVPLKLNGKFLTPNIGSDKKLIIHETFLSYCWAMTYSILVLYVETIKHPYLNKIAGREVKKINEDEIIKANDLFNYGRRIVVDFETWDKDKLPNPEIYLAENCDYVEQTNMYYTEVVKFILCHEFIHIEKQHIDAVLSRKHSDEEITKLEVEADAKAIDLIKEGMEPGREFISECGIVIGILILFFLNNSTKQYQHPDLEVRLIKAIKDLNISDDHFVWGITCVGLKLWDQQFDLKLEWNEEDDEKQRFDSIIDQIKRRKDIA